MKLGEKIRYLRKSAGLTQAALADGIITRNMLSSIENGSATPSFQTLKELSERLKAPLAFLISDEIDVSLYRKAEVIDKIRAELKAAHYSSAIERINSLPSLDDELAYILALCHFEIASAAVKNGELNSAKAHLDEFLAAAEKTVYDLKAQRAVWHIYSAIISNIQMPQNEFDAEKYEKAINDVVKYEYYKYIVRDTAFSYTKTSFSNHIQAKSLIKERRYYDAVKILTEIEANKTPDYDAVLIFDVYTDLELCYRQLRDFENAYRYSTKRLSLLEAYKS